MKEQFKQWADLNKATVETVQKLAEINSSLTSSLLNQQLDFISVYADSSAKQLKSLSEAKRIQDVFAIQSETVQELSKKALEGTRVSIDILVDSKNKISSLIEEASKEVVAFNPFSKLAA